MIVTKRKKWSRKLEESFWKSSADTWRGETLKNQLRREKAGSDQSNMQIVWRGPKMLLEFTSRRPEDPDGENSEGKEASGHSTGEQDLHLRWRKGTKVQEDQASWDPSVHGDQLGRQWQLGGCWGLIIPCTLILWSSCRWTSLLLIWAKVISC